MYGSIQADLIQNKMMQYSSFFNDPYYFYLVYTQTKMPSVILNLASRPGLKHS